MSKRSVLCYRASCENKLLSYPLGFSFLYRLNGDLIRDFLDRLFQQEGENGC
jgi:hypothetical protein